MRDAVDGPGVELPELQEVGGDDREKWQE